MLNLDLGINRTEDIATFASAYHAVNPLSNEEKADLDRLYASACYHAACFLENYCLTGSNLGLENPRAFGEWF